MNYDTFFERYPEFYRKFHRLVDHAGNFGRELETRSYLTNVKSLLSIGAGEGELETGLARDKGIEMGYIDPTPDFFETFNDNVNKFGLGKLVREAFYGKFENYSSSLKYDLVISIHSWYAFGLNREILAKVLSCVAAGGRLFITVISRDSVTWKLGELCGGVAGVNLNAEELSSWATGEGFKHEFFLNKKNIPSTRILKGDRLSIKGKAFASFLTFTPWTRMGEETKGSVTELIRSEAARGVLELQCGCLVFQNS